MASSPGVFIPLPTQMPLDLNAARSFTVSALSLCRTTPGQLSPPVRAPFPFLEGLGCLPPRAQLHSPAQQVLLGGSGEGVWLLGVSLASGTPGH